MANADVTVTIGGVKAAGVTDEAAGRVLAAWDASVTAQRLAVQVRGFAVNVRAA